MDPANKVKEYSDNLDRETILTKLKENWHLGGLTLVFLLAFMLRYMPEKGMQYLQAADPYFIFRMSQHLALEGTMPQVDFMRYFPYAAPTYSLQIGDFIVPAVLYNLGFSLFFENYLEWAQFYPALLGAASTVVMYFLGKEHFNKNTGLAAAFFLAVISGALRRTSAGFFEKEPLGTFLMVTSLLFFTRAWKRESWENGIMAGLTLGIFTISWGGSQMLWLLYPILTGITLFLNIEIRSLIAAYTPTVLIGGFFAAFTNPGRFWFTDSLFLIASAALGLLWLRYLVEEFEVVQEKYLPYFVPSMGVLGFFMAVLSPIYSQWVADKILRLVSLALGKTGNSVIGKTVQENAAPGVNSLATSLGSVLAGRVPAGLEIFSMLLSPWTFMIVSIVATSTALMMMLGKKYGVFGDVIPGKKHIAYTQAVFVATIIFMVGLVLNFVFISAFAAAIVAATILATVYFLDEDSAFSISTLMLLGTAVGLSIASFRFTGGLFTSFAYLTLWPTLAAVAGSAILNYLDHFPEREITCRWYMIIPLVWIGSNLYGGTTRSRLVFLSTFAVALGAGHGLNIVISKLRALDYDWSDNIDSDNLKTASLLLVLALVLGMNFFSGFSMSQGIRGSPTPSPQLWEQSLDYMEDETPNGSVVLSWWDYGYNFQTLGNRASVADGGNLRYYTSEGDHMNYRLASYLNSTTANDTDYLEQTSADYIWLDHSMIGKFSAVSQIANKDNQDYQAMAQFSTPGALQSSLSEEDGQTVAQFRGRLGRDPVSIYAPVEFTNSSAGLSGPPTVRFADGQTAEVGCLLTEDGREDFDVERDLGFCAVEDPFYSLERGAAGTQSRLILVPEKITDSTLVKLYLQDGRGVDYAEKVPEASNGYIKMWEITE
ncbi:STT3 domain-containing protein [Candidatus Nanohalobium constans]|uniref:dolichyl-phosphooligosaccharide-protein glycotransferase n=1 Tax=Candidatus Nanohalobium constans TaxID=2565781 RepID=A0A5Q0UH84_9ARCH|nr:STT3 domain-containing protein [Candidatus Nanohalobium constans]QGA81033.1 dolichyl-diphosphooligosaccharide--protein glycosyltransferase [Candidatus Nanohalobium constans]